MFKEHEIDNQAIVGQSISKRNVPYINCQSKEKTKKNCQTKLLMHNLLSQAEIGKTRSNQNHTRAIQKKKKSNVQVSPSHFDKECQSNKEDLSARDESRDRARVCSQSITMESSLELSNPGRDCSMSRAGGSQEEGKMITTGSRHTLLVLKPGQKDITINR